MSAASSAVKLEGGSLPVDWPVGLRGHVWRAAQDAQQQVQNNCVPSGFDALDALLPGGGWPQAGLVELLLGAVPSAPVHAVCQGAWALSQPLRQCLNLETAVDRAQVGLHWHDPARRDDAAPPWARGGTTPLGGARRAQLGVERFHPTGDKAGSQKHEQNQMLIESCKRSTAVSRLNEKALVLIGAPRPDAEPFLPGLVGPGHPWLWLQPSDAAQALWSAELALRCHDAGLVQLWWTQPPALQKRGKHTTDWPTALRRLHVLATDVGKPLWVHRHESMAAQASAAPLRLRIAASPHAEWGHVDVHIVKRKGPPVLQAITLNVRSPRLQALAATQRPAPNTAAASGAAPIPQHHAAANQPSLDRLLAA